MDRGRLLCLGAILLLLGTPVQAQRLESLWPTLPDAAQRPLLSTIPLLSPAVELEDPETASAPSEIAPWKRVVLAAGVGAAFAVGSELWARGGEQRADSRLVLPTAYAAGTTAGLLLISRRGGAARIAAGAALGAVPLFAAGGVGDHGKGYFRGGLVLLGIVTVPTSAVFAQGTTRTR